MASSNKFQIEPYLLQKYNKPVPRYTSYPPVPFWSGTSDKNIFINHLKSVYDSTKGIDLYIHVPFCEKLCYYCGCHRVVSKNKGRGAEYAELVKNEWSSYLKELGDISIASIHFGGGTPNFLDPVVLENLLSVFKPYFMEKFRGSFELDPRTCTEEHLRVLRSFGFSRLSLGIQDFSPKVQEAIARIQSYDLVSSLTAKMNQLGFEEYNFDLIYGLPFQTLETISDTIEKVVALAPAQIAFYSYAHLPDKLKNQKLINEAGLPKGDEKRQLYELGKKLLLASGYIEIGLDHFAKENSILHRAYKEHRLQRNFMGHVEETSNIILGLGVSSISSTGISFFQNTKELKTYKALIEANQLPVDKGHVHTPQDIRTAITLQYLFTHQKVKAEYLMSYIDNPEVMGRLSQLKIDGLVKLKDSELVVTKKGIPFLRNIASAFDHHLKDHQFGMAL